VLIIWTGEVYAKNGTADDEVTWEKAKVTAQQIGITNVHNSG
jgi:hypothetical protein